MENRGARVCDEPSTPEPWRLGGRRRVVISPALAKVSGTEALRQGPGTRSCQWIDATLAGFGPKQSRNFWQALGLTRYETPIDSRVTDWAKEKLSFKIDGDRLANVRYYEHALDYLQAVCAEAGLLPCLFDALAFDYENETRGGIRKKTTDPSFMNVNGQITIRNTGLSGTGHRQYVYQLACSECGHIYGANDRDIHERKCPVCQGGRPGLSLLTEESGH